MKHTRANPPACSLLSAILVLALAMAGESAAADGGGVGLNEKAPSFQALRIDGAGVSKLNSRELAGRPLLLVFCATWCGPCADLDRALVEMRDKFSEKGLQVVVISDEPEEKVRRYLLEHPAAFPIAVDPEHKTYEAFGIATRPQGLLIDKGGIVRWIGDPRYLPAAKLEVFLDTGGAIRSAYQTTSHPAAAESEDVFVLKLSRSRTDKFRNYGIGSGGSESAWTLNARGKPLKSILLVLLGVSRPRVIFDASIPETYYDVEYRYMPTTSQPSLRQPLLDAICRELNVEIRDVEEEHDVLVARARKSEPARSTEVASATYERGLNVLKNVTVESLIESIESATGSLVVDETGWKERYDFSVPWNANAVQVRLHLSARFGIVLTKERRKTRVIHVVSRKTASQPAR